MNKFQQLQAQELRSLAMVLSLSDLPGAGWSVVGENSWRLGVKFPREKSDALKRAREAKLCAAVCFYRRDGVELGFWSQVEVFASSEDAASRVPQVPAQVLNNRGRTLLKESTFADMAIPGTSQSVVFEQSSTGRDGSGVGQYAAGSTDNVVFIVACTTIDYGRYDDTDVRWPWSELLALAEQQANKIRRIQKEPTN